MHKTFCHRYPSPISQIFVETLGLIRPLAKLIADYSVNCKYEPRHYDSKVQESAPTLYSDAAKLFKDLENLWRTSPMVIRDWWITPQSQWSQDPSVPCVNILVLDHWFWQLRPHIFSIIHPHGLCCTARFFDKMKSDLELFSLARANQQSIPICLSQTTCRGKIKNVSLLYNFVTCFVLDHMDDGSPQEQTITFYYAGRWKGFLRNRTGKHAVYIDPQDVVVYRTFKKAVPRHS
jgi:hypothetical protein